MEVAWFVRAVLDSGMLRVWTGNGDYELAEPFGPDGTAPGDTATYNGGVRLIGIADAQLRFAMADRGLLGTPVVGRVVDIFLAGRMDGQDWQVLPGVRRGLLDSPQLAAGEYSVSVAPRRYPRGGRQWSHEEHERDNPDDTFFSQVRALAKGINGIHFPGVPNFREDGEYDSRAIQKPIGRSGGIGDPDDGLDGAPLPQTAGLVAVPGSAPVKLTAARSSIRRGF